jgi:microcystin-dependent protein
MSTPFLGEIKMVSFNFAPKNWALCNGQLLPINQNQALFALLGTTYGGNGTTTFALPDLRGRIPLHFSGQTPQGEANGETAHTLIAGEMPQHNHIVSSSSNAPNKPGPSGNFLATGSSLSPYTATSDSFLAPQATGSAGGSQPHENRPPFLVVNFAIALAGIFPSRN